MGQAASKVVSKSSSSQNVKKATSTIADPLTGFMRGKGPLSRQDAEQQAFLQQHTKSDKAQQDMPEGLIKFLNDAGPLKPKEGAKDKIAPRTPRVPRHLRQQELEGTTAASSGPPVDKSRHQELMPLAKGVEGFETMRTNSFSSRVDVVDNSDFGLDILDYYRLLSKKGDTDACDTFYKMHKAKLQNALETASWTDDQESENEALLRQSLEALQLPVIMKDTDDSYVGAWPHKVQDYTLMKLREMKKSQVKLVVEDLVDIENSKEPSPVR